VISSHRFSTLVQTEERCASRAIKEAHFEARQVISEVSCQFCIIEVYFSRKDGQVSGSIIFPVDSVIHSSISK
jgi:hypothetical protein